MRRCWWALVVLAAVFAMHGLQCVSDGSHPLTEHGVASPVMSLSLPTLSGSGAPAIWSADHAPHDVPDLAGRATSLLAPDGASPDLPADFWAVCLAVLSAGLALLATVLLRPGAVARARAPSASGQTWFGAPALPRAPDLFALCVLRN